ncbi:MAG: hypothetical protein IJ313_09215 [Clostridia bacterium]|nr:hypothetical protein [Clostridia bacterium]
MDNDVEFNELVFFSKVKRRPGMFFGRKSLISLRDQLGGMIYAFSVCGNPDALKLFKGFVGYYNNWIFHTDRNGYACWWNHLLYISGGMDEIAFDSFFRKFEAYLLEEHNLKLPETE